MDLSSIVETLRDLSILVAAVIGAYSIDAWRREHVGRRQLDLAEEALALFYEARDAMSYIRSPGSFGHEKLDLEQASRESDEQFKARENASVVFYRHNQHERLFSKLHSLRYRFKAQFGKEKTQPFEDFSSAHRKVLGSARHLARYWPQDRFRTEEQREEHDQRIERQEAIFWEDYSDTDEIREAIDNAVAVMETTCRGVIEGRGTLYGILNKNL